MKFEAYSFSSVRLSILSGAISAEEHHLLKLELNAPNIINNFNINNLCFHNNKSFGILKEDYFKIVKILKKKKLKFQINESLLKELDEFYVIKFNNGEDVIDYFQNINMNNTNDRPRLSDNQVLREIMITSIKKINDVIFKYNPSMLSLDIEIQNNKDEIFEPSECGLVFFKDDVIEYKHYLIKEYYQLKTGNGAALQKKFSFGKTEIITFNELILKIQEYLEKTDLFIAHSVNSENHYLARMGISLPYEVDYIIDTQLIYREIDKINKKPIALIDLLDKLKIKNNHLHNAGNDAVYTWLAFKEMIKINEK